MSTVPGGLEHLGLLHDTPEDLVATVLPRVRATLAAGGRVSAIVPRRTRRLLLEALGPDPGITFTTAGALRPPPPAGLVAHVRDLADPPGGLVLAEYAALDLTDDGLRAAEESIDRLPADLPVTVVCACSGDACGARTATLRNTHRRLLDRAGSRCGPDAPEVRDADDAVTLPRPGDVPVLALAVRGTADLRGLRAEIERVARRTGRDDDGVHRAVLAVHEAAVVVGSVVWPGGVACTIDVWTDGRSLAVAVRGPRPAGLAGPAVGTGERPVDPVRLFCRAASIEDTVGGRTVRLVTE
ncbi:hypothetical protein [Actinomycetospora chiangmaiensis]|uniref:hypothetical protein n=1 Tax=Actinomycetospora chiangmaiensis TaxID=402650 RepID=UPI00037BC99F|nr:hypothetical protein [Actinomycetospora chiangmaiensis]